MYELRKGLSFFVANIYQIKIYKMSMRIYKGKKTKIRNNNNCLPSELDDFSASVCAANAFVRSNSNS